MLSARKRPIKKEQNEADSPKKKIKTENANSPKKQVKKVKAENVAKPKKPRKEKCSAKTVKGEDGEIEGGGETSSNSCSATVGVSWQIPAVIATNLSVPEWACKNVVQLLEEGCTFPFIARYRKERTGNMDIQKLRDACSLVEELKSVESKVKTVKMKIEEQRKMTKEVDTALSNAQSLTEVECLYAPFKPGAKGSLAERARGLGLEPLAISLLEGNFSSFQLAKYINPDEPGLKTEDKILEGVKYIIADMIHKHPAVMEIVRDMPKSGDIYIVSNKTKENKTQPKPGAKVEPEHKFSLYFDFRCGIRSINPHQVMAMNRGETQGILNIKLDVPGRVKDRFSHVCWELFQRAYQSEMCREIFVQCFNDAFNRLIQPQIMRLARSSLTKKAEWASIEVFASNLKHLLLSAPLKGNTILAIDPGFRNGCKTAVISSTGQVLDTDILYLCGSNTKYEQLNKLKKLVYNHRPKVIAIGNGQACRETEEFVSHMIQSDFPDLKYCIVGERGASVYSVSEIAQQELPSLDHSLRGAVSIGRRLLDPLAEYVKVDPKHLSVGQYQHDLPKAQLKAALDSTVEECVSFVGVDINTCSECLLKHVSGLSATLAKKIIEHRNTSGPFVCRNSLKLIKGLGAKTFEQAAGFIRVHHLKTASGAQASSASVKVEAQTETETAGKKKRATSKKKKDANDLTPSPLDMTCIHPESYNVTHRLLEMLDVNVMDLGTNAFIDMVKRKLSNHTVKSLAEKLDSGEQTIQLIIDSLTRPLTYDLRDNFEKPLFRSAVKNIKDLKTGDRMTGKVSNVTSFGAFIDIGVGTDGLVHVSGMTLPGTRQRYPLKLGEKIEVTISNIEAQRGRIGLQLQKVL